MLLNLQSRLAQRVLVEVADGPYRDEHDLYDARPRASPGRDWITPRADAARRHHRAAQPAEEPELRGAAHQGRGLRPLRDAAGERPERRHARGPTCAIVLHVGAERAALYVDSSGEPLFKRGWREDKGDAPLKETLAAAMLAAAGWRGTPAEGGALHDPCCGTGTIAIEAAQIACGIAPGLLRRFAFERLLPFATPTRRAELQRLQVEGARRACTRRAVPIFASDVSFRMVDFARRNAERAGVARRDRVQRRRRAASGRRRRCRPSCPAR